MEQWVELKCYDRQGVEMDLRGKYIISSFARVKNVLTGQFVAPQLAGKPQYFYVNLTPYTGKRRLIRLHTLVAYSFLGRPSNLKDTCDHIDRNPYNNCLDNLRWASRFEQNVNRGVTLQVDGDPLVVLAREDGYVVEDIGYIRRRVYDGLDYNSAKESLLKYKSRGGRYESIIEVEGVTIDLWDWCKEHNLTYHECNLLLKKGWSHFNILLNIDPRCIGGAVEVGNICFPTLDSFKKVVGEGRYKRLHADGYSYEEILNYDPQDKDRVWIDGFFMTKKEHCSRVGTSVERVDTMMYRYNVSLEDALKIKPQKVIKHTINGVTKRNSDWARYYGINPKTLNKYLCKGNTFEKTLSHFGVDTTNLEITPFI